MSDAGSNHQAKTLLTAISGNLRKALRQDLNPLRVAVDEHLTALETAIDEADASFARAIEDMCETRRQDDEKAQRALNAAGVRAQEEIATVRAELEATRVKFQALLAEREAVRVETATALAQAQQEIAAVRRTCEEQAERLSEAHRRAGVIEEEYAQWSLARQVEYAHVEEERQRRKTIAIQLETAHEELRLAKAEAKAYRLEVQQGAERIQRLEDARMQSEHSSDPTAPSYHVDAGAVLDRLRNELNSLTDATTAEEILTVLLEALSRQFLTVALFAVGRDGFKLWRTRNADLGSHTDFPVVPLTSESPLALAFRQRTMIMGDASPWNTALPTTKRRFGQCVAFPVLANDRVVAVAYVENPPDRPIADLTLFTTVAEILIDRVNHRLQDAQSLASKLPSDASDVEENQPTPTPSESPHYVLARQARRVPIEEGIKVVVNGVASALVDLSTLGAQIVSSKSVRPNGPVRIAFPSTDGPFSCKARVVWARAEQTQENAFVVYRVGVEFTEVEISSVQAFATRHGALRKKPAASRLERESATP
jgi:PilZ domain/GAF domain